VGYGSLTPKMGGLHVLDPYTCVGQRPCGWMWVSGMHQWTHNNLSLSFCSGNPSRKYIKVHLCRGGLPIRLYY